MRKLFALFLLSFMLAPAPAGASFSFEGESPVFTRSDQEFLREMMKIQKQAGDVIKSISDDWGLEDEEMISLSSLSGQLSEAIRSMSGTEKRPADVAAPVFSEKRCALLRKAAKLQVEADNIILKMVDQKSVDQIRLERLRSAMEEIAGILGEIEKN